MITTIQFKTLDDLYQFYNDAIFNGELSECIVNMSRHGGAFGFFAANRWRGDGLVLRCGLCDTDFTEQ